jgi:hypothetical protein
MQILFVFLTLLKCFLFNWEIKLWHVVRIEILLIFLFVFSGNIHANDPTKAITDKTIYNSLDLFKLPNGDYGVSGIQKTTIDSSSAWGVINLLHDSSIAIAYQKARPVDGFQEAVTVDIYLARSVDGGKNWTKTLVAEAPHPYTRSDGLIEFYQFRNLSMGQKSNGELIIAFSKLVYVKEKTGEAVIQNADLKSSFYYGGFYKVFSNNKGVKFSKPSEIKF